MAPSARLTSVRIEAEGVSATAVEKILVEAALAMADAIGGDVTYGDQVIEMDHAAMSTGVTSNSHVYPMGSHKGRAKLWPNVADDAGQFKVFASGGVASIQTTG